MKLTIVGGGGFRVPLIYDAILRRRNLAIDEVILYDPDETRMSAIVAVLRGLERPPHATTRLHATTSLPEALHGTDFVFSAIRVGGTTGRVIDERVALERGHLGQETTGAGGIAYGLRSIPEMVNIAHAVAEHAPEAWTINFTNPVGMVTEAMASVLGDRVIGICDSPLGLCRRVARLLDADPRRMWFDYFGLNHLGWLRAAYLDGHNVLPGLLRDTANVATTEEGAIFGVEWLRDLGMIPNEYLHYYYNHDDAVRAILTQEHTRGEYLDEQQSDFYQRVLADPDSATNLWREVRASREESYMREARESAGSLARHSHDLSGGYEEVALDVMQAIATNAQKTLILNVRNSSALPILDADAVVEVPCVVGSNGPRPVAVGQVPEHAAGLMLSVKAVERDTIAAALTNDRSRATRALALHPLVQSVSAARQLFDGYIGGHPGFAARFDSDATATNSTGDRT